MEPEQGTRTGNQNRRPEQGTRTGDRDTMTGTGAGNKGGGSEQGTVDAAWYWSRESE